VKFSILLLFLLSVTGCGSYSLTSSSGADEEGVIKPVGTLFDRFLYEGYRHQGKKEDMQHDYTDSDFYTAKSLAAARGEWVAPQEVADRDIPKFAIADLLVAKSRLDRALLNGSSVKLPEYAARAQVMFDCWLEQQEENIQQHDIDECKHEFDIAMLQLEKNYMGAPMSACGVLQSSSPSEKEEDCTTIEQPQAVYSLYFILDSIEMVADSKAQLLRLQNDLSQNQPMKVYLTGHADRSGSSRYNEGLSLRRVKAVAEQLSELVPNEKVIERVHFGENRPKVETPDGVRELRNRRVEVEVRWSK
jgi:OOP family OmpA-OmpF porin